MHLSLILVAIALAWSIRRWAFRPLNGHRWQQTLEQFLLPPLLFLLAIVAVLCMGTQGQMLGLPAGWLGCGLAWGAIAYALLRGVLLAGQAANSIAQVRSIPIVTISTGEVAQTPVRLVESESAIAAQIGFWQPDLVISRGLIELLTPDQLAAVLTHEQAHQQYRDTFWFFWLGWVRQLTAWLPRTEALWQELLLLRELRADRWASQQVDPLLLAESLLLVVQSPLQEEEYCAAFSAIAPATRLEERIDALLSEPIAEAGLTLSWRWLLPILPLLTLLLHR
ncbi:M56 family metallopeptidase [Microcoleus sp. FACHB-1515]|uniref:M56 family metallopeptidase n=1 Tax=Cyanophyceae TaxID=3028117 RepID=UPI001688ADDC|nr:M56 family metallopeptidase [Microcoleus sp. FACHB-1515]MBD2091690.1 M56 family metallopeptidase [Microcoleus sp. FACHB-1515]